MSNDELSDDRPEPLAEQMPDPSGPPQPEEAQDAWSWCVTVLGVGAVLIGGLVTVSATVRPCVGATRSARIEWQRRQSQIEQAAEAARAGQGQNVQEQSDDH